MAMEFTTEQKKAIETLDRSVLVSAAAGSGKTAILVERILRIILDGKANVDELLVVTFTRAAAAEMKVRLASAIRKRMREQPGDAARLKDQLSRLYRAYITTIDSFALRVIREFFYESDSDPDFKACDEVQSEIMKREALSELFDAGFENDHFLDADSESSTGFREFLRLYSEERQEDSFKEKFLTSYDRLRTIPDYFEWAYDKALELNVTADNFEGSGLQATMSADALETFNRACDGADRMRAVLEDAGLSEMFESKLSTEVSMLHNLREIAREGKLTGDFLEQAASVSWVSLRASKAEKESYDPVKDEIKALRKAYKDEINNWNNKYSNPDFSTRLSEMNGTYKYTVYYIRMLEEFERRYTEKKRERHVMDFADMEHSAVRILRKQETADILRKRFRFVFIDEYQDTNRIQEELISSVARPDNVFRVGDIKQSIYRFRQAEPDIFREVYNRFSDPACEDGTAIDLSCNFRTNPATINYINRVFEDVMEGYDDRAKLNPGTFCMQEYDFIPEVHILTTDGQEDDTATSDSDEETVSLGKEEAEADYIAGIVNDIIGTEFHDTKAGVIRKAEPRDIVILFRSVKTRGEIVSAALRRHGIEPHIEDSDDYFDTVEIGIAMSLLSCIDNMKRDVPLIASLHSEAFGWSPAELAGIRIAHSEYLRSQRSLESSGEDTGEPKQYRRPAYWEALKWYQNDGPEGDLKNKAVYAVDKILKWRKMSHMMPLEDFVWYVLVDSGYYRMAGAMHGGSRRQANLRTLADRAAGYSSESIASLSSYIAFVDVMRQKKIKSGQAPAAAGDEVVRISTIHKSKGLEYPFVIVGGLGHRFRKDSNEKSFSFDSSIGVGLPYIDPDRKYWRSTLVQRAINAKSLRDSYSEDLRVLYVAMTRARNKLIMVGTCDNETKLNEYTSRPDNYLRVIRNVLRTGFNKYFVKSLNLSVAEQMRRALNIPDPDRIVLTEEELAIYNEIDRRFTYEYPDKDLLTSKAKYSVSELRRSAASEMSESPDDTIEQEADNNIRQNRSGSDLKPVKRTAVSAAEIGTGYHRIMEFLDFARVTDEEGSVDTEYIDERIRFLRGRGALREEVFSEVETERIADFFRTDIGRRAVDAARRGVLMKEKAFTLRTAKSAGESANESRNHPVLVQGVIDCCFEENGKMVLIDYKTSYVRPGRQYSAELQRIKNEYRVQMDLYSEAILKGTGMQVSEAYLYLFSTGEPVCML